MKAIDPGEGERDMLRWLVRLRWVAVAGQSVAVMAADRVLRIELPLLMLFASIAVTGVSNLAMTLRLRRGRNTPRHLPLALLVTDVTVLTTLLGLTGGPDNPFALFYLVPATTAAIALSGRAAWLVWALCSVGYGLLFALRESLAKLHHHAFCGPAMDYDLHLRGMLISLVLTAAAIAYFVSHLMRALRQREAQLRDARAREAVNERFASLATLAAGVAHEIGSPLGTIGIAAGELRRASARLPAGHTIREDADLIAEEVGRCRSILDRLSDRAGALGDLPCTVSVERLFSDLLVALPAADRPRLRVEGPAAPAELVAPPLALVQALGVLIKNAFDASPPGVEVWLKFEAVAGEVRFRVEDQGAGLPASARAHAGEPFFTTKEPGRGLGLGLFLVRLFAHRLHGSLHLESNWPDGTRATLTFPQPATL